VARFDTYRARAIALPFLLMTYFLLALIGPRDGHLEFYPFFNWSLFSLSTPVRSDAVLVVRSIDGQTFERPKLFFDMADTFAAARSDDAVLPKMLDDLIRAKWSGDISRVAELRRVIEQRFLVEAANVEWSAAVAVYDPIVRYRSGAINRIDAIADFNKGKL
jgi:hypothetical protein